MFKVKKFFQGKNKINKREQRGLGNENFFRADLKFF